MAKASVTRSAGAAQVSVVVPTRDRWDVLAMRALPAALGQEEIPIEVIVVDDFSSAPPCEARWLEDPRVRMIRQPAHRGVASARNLGIRAASGAWIAFLDDDDVWAPRKLASLLGAIEASNADFGFSSALAVDDQVRPLWLEAAPPIRDLFVRLLRGNVIPGGASNVVARRSLLERCGGFDEEFAALADWDLWLRLAQEARAASTQEILLAFRRASWVLGETAVHRDEAARLARKYAAAAEGRGVTIDLLTHDTWMARSLLLAGRRRAAARSFIVAGLRHRSATTIAYAARTLLPMNLTSRIGRSPRGVGPEPAWLRRYRVRPG
jgi:glycosyltransferase involved in cell wall biosynthesis